MAEGNGAIRKISKVSARDRADGVDERIERDRIKRVEEMYVKGGTTDDIADALGISYSKALDYLGKVKKAWRSSIDRDYWRGRLLATYEAQQVELWEQWNRSKMNRETVITNPDGSQTIRTEPADPRWISGLLAVSREMSQLLGVRDGSEAINNVVIDQSVRTALSPLSPADYMKMLEQGLPVVNSVTKTLDN